MFSIIICSINKPYLEALKKNITETIGHPYELLVWDNLKTPKPITEVYNLLGDQARFPYLCFIHEDILFQTKDWSAHLAEAFDRHTETGMIGVAGSKYKSKTPSGWSTGIKNWDCVNIFHRDKNRQTHHLYSNPGGSMLEPVVNVDGVFIAIRREVWTGIRFNDQMLRGFHLYDIDFSFQVTSRFDAMVIFSIDIIHLTEGGNFGNEWVEYTLNWHRKYAGSLPRAVAGIKSVQAIERKIRKNWLFRLSTEKISWKNKMNWLMAGGALWDLSAWPYIGLFLFKRYFRAGK
jgi:glycosyltransferase involved in cell wall biosynthesis